MCKEYTKIYSKFDIKIIKYVVIKRIHMIYNTQTLR